MKSNLGTDDARVVSLGALHGLDVRLDSHGCARLAGGHRVAAVRWIVAINDLPVAWCADGNGMPS
jgi:hypothetical protein